MKPTKGKWRKSIVEWEDAERPRTVNISVVFSWDAQRAFSRAVWWRQQGYEVRVGGPGVFTFAVRRMFDGLAEVGGDLDGTVVRHNPSATFSSRGCPVGCSFCIVPAMEGKEIIPIDNFIPRPVLCDNNLSAMPEDWQDEVIDRYRRTETPLLDANSGFEPLTFDQTVLRRWEAIYEGPWRYAYDETSEGPDVERVCKMLADYKPNQKRVYVLIGNEPFDACMERIQEVIAWGAEPHAQPEMKLNAMTREPWEKYDWTRRRLRAVARWTNQWVWRNHSFRDYEKHNE